MSANPPNDDPKNDPIPPVREIPDPPGRPEPDPSNPEPVPEGDPSRPMPGTQLSKNVTSRNINGYRRNI